MFLAKQLHANMVCIQKNDNNLCAYLTTIMPQPLLLTSEYAQMLRAVRDSLNIDSVAPFERLQIMRNLMTQTDDTELHRIYNHEINRYTRALNSIPSASRIRNVASGLNTAASVSSSHAPSASRIRNVASGLNTAASVSSSHDVAQQPSITDTLQAKGVVIPNEYLCPITMELMTDPVILEDGHVYEKIAIKKWFETRATSPLTKRIVNRHILISCHIMRSTIQDFIKKHSDSCPIEQIDMTTHTCPIKKIDMATQTCHDAEQLVSLKKTRKKREPTEYNKFVKERMSVYRQQNTLEAPKELMKKIAQEWIMQKNK
jgi:hypothetical protein